MKVLGSYSRNRTIKSTRVYDSPSNLLQIIPRCGFLPLITPLNHLLATSTGADRSSGNRTVVVSVAMHVLRSITLQAVAVSMSERATTVRSPANLASEDGVNELSTTHGVVERSTSVKGDVVEAPVPDSGVGHSVSGESKDGSNDGASKDIVEVVILVDSESSTDENGTEKRGVGDDELPHGRMVVGEDLELGVEVKVEIDEASKGSSGVTTGHGLKSIVDLALVASANIGSVVKLKISLVVVSSHGASASHVGLADLKEMRSESTDEPLDKDLEDGGGDEGVEKTDDSVVDIPE